MCVCVCVCLSEHVWLGRMKPLASLPLRFCHTVRALSVPLRSALALVFGCLFGRREPLRK